MLLEMIQQNVCDVARDKHSSQSLCFMLPPACTDHLFTELAPAPGVAPAPASAKRVFFWENRHATLEYAVFVHVSQIGQLHLAAMRMVWIQKCCLRDQRLWGSAKSLRS